MKVTDSIEELLENEFQKQKELENKKERVLKIVMVDDIKSISSSMKRELMHAVRNAEGMKFNILDFQDPEIALQYMVANRPDLLISDIKMPFLMGDKLVEDVKALYPNLPVIVVTGFATKENILSVYKSDKNSIILSKPWEPERFLQAVNKLLNLNLSWSE